MKKILFLNHNQENFGTYYRCLFLAKGLSENGYKIKMLCASGKNFDLFIRKKKINENFTIITLPRIKYHQYFTGQIGLRLPLTILYVLFDNYDICHAFTVAQPQIGIPAWMAKVIKRKKLIVDWDDLWGKGFAEEHSSFISKVLSWSERYFIKFADRITYVSEFIGEQIDKLNLGIKKIKIPNGANTKQIKVLDKIESRKKLNLDIDKKYLISVANTYTDSLGIMLNAFRKVIEVNNSVLLIMVGEAEITGKFKKLFNKLKHRIIITGKKPFSEIPLYLASADCLILPMDDNNIERARFPMRFGDYLCAGRPIISNAVGEVKYYLEKFKAGLISEPLDYNKMSENILKVLKDQKPADKISFNSRKLAEEVFSWDKIIKKLISKIYLNL